MLSRVSALLLDFIYLSEMNKRIHNSFNVFTGTPKSYQFRVIHLEANIFKLDNQYLAKIITLLQSFIIWGIVIYYLEGYLPYDMVNNSDTNFIKAFLTLCIFYFKFPLYGILESINLQLLNSLNKKNMYKWSFSMHFCVENSIKYFTLSKIISFTISTLFGLGILKFLNLNLDFIWIMGIGEILVLFNLSEYLTFKIFNPILKNKILSILYRIKNNKSFFNKPLRSASGGTGLSVSQVDDSGSSGPSLVVAPEDVEKYFLKETASFIKVINEENKKIVEIFKKISDANINYSDRTHDIYFTLLKSHANALNISYSNRGNWVRLCTKYFSPEVKSKLLDMETNREEIRESYLSKVEKLGNDKGSFREFFTLTNNYRNKLNKELNSAEEILHKNLRETSIYKNSQVKKLVNSDYVEAKKLFKNQDTILKKKFEEELFSKKD